MVAKKFSFKLHAVPKLAGAAVKLPTCNHVVTFSGRVSIRFCYLELKAFGVFSSNFRVINASFATLF